MFCCFLPEDCQHLSDLCVRCFPEVDLGKQVHPPRRSSHTRTSACSFPTMNTGAPNVGVPRVGRVELPVAWEECRACFGTRESKHLDRRGKNPEGWCVSTEAEPAVGGYLRSQSPEH